MARWLVVLLMVCAVLWNLHQRFPTNAGSLRFRSALMALGRSAVTTGIRTLLEVLASLASCMGYTALMHRLCVFRRAKRF